MDLPFDLDAEVVKLIKSKSIELPTYPGVALQLQRVINSGNYGISDLAKLVESDQGLATAVLRAANSAFYASTKPITMLAQAIARVGANSLNNIALAGTLGVHGSMEGPLVVLRKDSWRRSLISALLCQQLAPSRKLAAGEAFLAGLLHDFGETIAYACFEVLLESHPESRPQNAATWLWEAQRYHLELGMALAAEWKLPEFVLACVMRHHDAELSPALARLLCEKGCRQLPTGEWVFRHDPLLGPSTPMGFELEVAKRFWSKVQCDVLYVEGDRSTFKLPPEDHARRLGAFPHMRTKAMLGGSHMMIRHQPAAVSALLVEFLEMQS